MHGDVFFFFFYRSCEMCDANFQPTSKSYPTRPRQKKQQRKLSSGRCQSIRSIVFFFFKFLIARQAIFIEMHYCSTRRRSA